MPRTRVYATNAARQRAYRARRREVMPVALQQFPCVQLGDLVTLYCGDALVIAPLLMGIGALISDPPYKTSYDYTKARRRRSQWARNFVGADTTFDPTPWLHYPEVILFGADHYWERLPRRGSWWIWDKLAGTKPADFAPAEWLWLSKDGPPLDYSHLWRGGMRAGEENYVHLPVKLHQAQKPIALLLECVKQTTGTVLDPYMGSGTTGAACVRLGRPFVGIELEPAHFETACTRLAEEVAKPRQLPLLGTARMNPACM